MKTNKRLGCLVFLLPVCCLVSLTFAQEQTPQQQPPQQQPVKSIEEERLAIIKSDIQKEIEHNEKVKKDFEAEQKAAYEYSKERLLKVGKIYESMPPDEAAKKLEKLDEDTAVEIIGVLKPRAAGGILTEMDSEKAAAISKKLIIKKSR